MSSVARPCLAANLDEVRRFQLRGFACHGGLIHAAVQRRRIVPPSSNTWWCLAT